MTHDLLTFFRRQETCAHNGKIRCSEAHESVKVCWSVNQLLLENAVHLKMTRVDDYQHPWSTYYSSKTNDCIIKPSYKPLKMYHLLLYSKNKASRKILLFLKIPGDSGSKNEFPLHILYLKRIYLEM